MAKGSGTGDVAGTILLSQPGPNATVTMTITLTGFNATVTQKHGFHVHQIASLADKCNGSGPHLNIDNTDHGAPTNTRDKRHTGDLGNIESTSGGNVAVTITDWLISLYETTPTSVIGKPFVVHALEDDLGLGGAPTSNTTGNAGARLGCCIIQLTSTGSTSNSLPAWITLTLSVCAVIGQAIFNRIN